MPQTELLEHRQLTVLFCDIVDSTTIAQSLDAEKWRVFLSEFHNLCAKIFQQYGGYIHEYRGDGPLVYFGYPTPFEDSSYRAVKAGLELRKNFNDNWVANACFNKKILIPKVRISVHTGFAVTGPMSGRPTATGVMVALAERLQRVAPPNNLVVSSQVKKLVKERFEFSDLGKQKLKGFDDEKNCYLVVDEIKPKRKYSLFSGRKTELENLTSEWLKISPGAPRITLLEGTAGIGKTRLLCEFFESIESQKHVTLNLQCSRQYQNTPFYPLAHAILALLGKVSITEDTPDKTLFEPLLQGIPSDLAESVGQTFQALLPILKNNTFSLTGDSSQQERGSILNNLVTWLGVLSKQTPLLLAVEDVDQIDPSSLELLTRLLKEGNGEVFVLLSKREEHRWRAPFDVNIMRLEGISAESARFLIGSLDKDNLLPNSFYNLLVKQCDGVPLYLEELTAMMIEQSLSDKGASLAESFSGFSIPDTIQDLLTVRLSSVGPAKKTAQIASTIGRNFSFPLLQEVSGLTFEELERQITILEQARLIVKTPGEHQSQYMFRHALIADSAYASLVESDKIELHSQIAKTMENGLPGLPQFTEEILAHHFAVGGKQQKAITYWMLAGQSCKRRSALAEAIHHFTCALELLENLADDTDPTVLRQKLTAFSALAPCREALGGYSAIQAKKAYQQAEQIALRLKDEESLLLIRFGLAGFYLMRGDFRRAYKLGQLCRHIAEERCKLTDKNKINHLSNSVAMAQATFGLACVLFHRAEFSKSIPLMDLCLKYCSTSSPSVRKLRHDPAVMCHLYKAWYLWEIGQVTQALDWVQRGVEMSRMAGHPFCISVALAFQACIHLFRKEYKQTIDLATESINYSKTKGYLTWLAWSKVLRGRALCEWQSYRLKGIQEVEEGLRLWDQSGAIVTRPFALTLLAESYQLNNQIDNANQCIRKALNLVDKFGERYYFPEILRVSGELILADSENPDNAHTRAIKTFESALTFSEERGMHSSTLKSTISLSQLNWKLGNRQQAYLDLEKVCAYFDADSQTADLKFANNLLNNYRESLNNSVANI